MKHFKKIAFIFILGLFLFSFPLSILAAEENIIVKSEEIVAGNFIRFGNVIEIKGAINGDAIVAGNTILISGPVAGDVIAIGNTVKISGPVMGSIRVAANTLEVSNVVDRNVWAVANDFTLTKDAKVNWEINATALKISIQSPVGGNAWLSGAQIDLGGVFSKNVQAALEHDGKLNLSDQATVSGNLTYFAGNDNQFNRAENSIITGTLERKEPASPSPSNMALIFGPIFMFMRIISLFSLLVVGLVLISLFPKMVLQVKEKMMASPKESIGWGIVYSIVTPILILILMITIIGFPLALIVLPLYLILLYLSKIIAGFVIGVYLINYLSKEKKFKGNLIWPMVIGLAIVVLITSLPLLGFIIKLGLIWWALGALINSQKNVLYEWR